MGKVWFRVRKWNRTEIVLVTVDKFTDSSVWINGRRHARRSDYGRYFPTFVEAKEFLVSEIIRELQIAEKRMKDLQDELAQAENLTDQ